MAADTEFVRPFPALTPAQRYHFDAYGYTIVENALDADLCGRALDAMHRLNRDLEAAGDYGNAVVRGCKYSRYSPHHRHFAHIVEADPAITEYLTHPYLVGMAEEVVGGTVRLEESEAVINRRDPDANMSEPPKYGFHTGTRPEHGTYTENGLFHCNFVKTLTTLTGRLGVRELGLDTVLKHVPVRIGDLTPAPAVPGGWVGDDDPLHPRS